MSRPASHVTGASASRAEISLDVRRHAEVAAMRRAIELAANGLGMTSPNPVVGCVILDESGATVGAGFHQYAGGPHAEVNALREAGQRARGGTAVITLEPCAHTGKTPPCTAALLQAGIARAVVAVPDPNTVAAGGADVLRRAGVEVEVGLLAAEARRVNEAWLTAVEHGRPHVTWKYAASLDGRVAAADGSSRWITSVEARADVHRLRAQCDAVIVGSGTLLTDDPHLTVRLDGVRKQPLRVVLDTEARIRPSARVLDNAAPTLVAIAEDSDASHLPPHVDVVRLPRAAGDPSAGRTGRGLDLTALLAALRERDVISALLEGGPTLAGAFLSGGLVDKVVAYIAPALIGGGGAPALAGAGAATIADAVRLRIDQADRIGPDLRIVARPSNDQPIEEGPRVHRDR